MADEEHRHDRVPPYSEEAERGVLGAMMLEPLRVIPLVVVTMRIKAEHFYVPAHILLASRLIEMHGAGQAIDLSLVGMFLSDKGDLEKIGGHAGLERIFDAAPAAHAEHYAGIVRDKAIARGVLLRAQSIEAAVYAHEKTGEQLLLAAPQMFADIVGEVVREVPNIQVMDKAEAQWRDAKAFAEGDATKAPAIGIRTPIQLMTELTCGLEDGTLTILAARPSAGKTTLEGWLSVFAAEQGVPVARATMDASHKNLLQREMCRRARVSMPKLKFGFARHDQLKRIADAKRPIAELPMWINDQVATVEEACSWAMMMKAKHNIGLFTFDYLQLAGVSDTSRYISDNAVERATYIARRFKVLARQLDIPVLLLSQLSRGLEGDSRKGPRDPQLSDLRGSGEIEAAADKVWFLFVDRAKKSEMEDASTAIVQQPMNGKQLFGKPGATKHKRPVWFMQDKFKDGELGRIPLWLLAPYFQFELAETNKVTFQDFVNDQLPGDEAELNKEFEKKKQEEPRQEEFTEEPEEREEL